VEIHHDKANTRSGGIPRRLGYVFAGEAPDAPATPAAPGEVGIDCTWRMTRDAWEPRSSRGTLVRV
jgi:ribosomal-protein-serine acetyltransferase